MIRSNTYDLANAELNLLAALLLRALQDLTHHDEDVRLLAKKWFYAEYSNYICSFYQVCDALNLEPGWVRKRAELVMSGSEHFHKNRRNITRLGSPASSSSKAPKNRNFDQAVGW